MTDAHYPQGKTPAPAWRGMAALALLTLLVAGCASNAPRKGGESEAYGLGEDRYSEPGALAAVSNDVLMRAIGLVGTPYRYGGNTPDWWLRLQRPGRLRVQGRRRPGPAAQHPRPDRSRCPQGRPRQPAAGRPGVLQPRGGRVSHIGIYVGEDRFVHAPSAGGTVRLDSLESAYWRKYYVSAKRILN